LPRHTLNLLKAECGRGGLWVRNKRARFDYRYRQCVQLRQPTENACSLLAQRNDVLINGVEIALDLNFKNGFERDAAREFFHKHLVRRWHGSRQKIHVYQPPQQKQAAHDHSGQCRYDAARSAPNKIVVYSEDFTRITGEPDCLHIEWRTTRARATRATGIESVGDLLVFDHRRFWQKRLRLYDVDCDKLGLMMANRSEGRRHRRPKTIPRGNIRCPSEARTGEHYAQKYETTQELIHQMKPICRIHRALIPLSIEIFLPPHTS